MTRANRYLRSLGSNTILLLVNTAYTLITMPVALRCLGADEFGVWIVASSMAGYLAMIDLGTSGATVRLLIDHKDHPENGTYGSLIKSALLVQAVQALLIFGVGLALTPWLAGWMKIDPTLRHEFNVLWLWQVGLLSLNFLGRIGLQLLTAHQRLDVVNYATATSLLVSFGLLVILFQRGAGVYSFGYAQTLASLIVLGWTLFAAFRQGLFPSVRGTINRLQLRGLFGFGSEMFFVALGMQFITGSQTFILTRWLGLEATAIWTVMTKVFSLVSQLVWRMITVAMPAFAEMLVRGEQGKLGRRYRSLFEMTMLAAVWAGLLMALGNSAFVDLWTHGRIRWEPVNDGLLALWFVLLTMDGCHNNMIINTKRMGAATYMYFIEGAAFIALALLVVPRFGLPGMLVCSIACTILFTLNYGTRRVARLMGVPVLDVAIKWLKPAACLLVVTVPIGTGLAWLTRDSSLLRLAVCVVPMAVVGALAAARFCVPAGLGAELVARAPSRFRRPAVRLFGHKPG